MGVIWIDSGRFAAYDPDAQAYITAVEQADTQALEAGVKNAINTFVVGCKTDGIWTAIKASCILAGARTLAGALVPLVGTAPTNNNFVSGDYNRKTGLVGDASIKYLDSNRNNNIDPQDSKHISVYVSTAATSTQFGADIGSYLGAGGDSYIGRADAAYQVSVNSNLSSGGSSNVTGFRGANRSASASFVYRAGGSSITLNQTSNTPANTNIHVFKAGSLYANSRLAFYSIGESLDLSLLDSRITTLINTIGQVIP